MMPNDTTVFLNDKLVPLADAKISVNDRGFVFGDGIYEVWRTVEGKLFEFDRHYARMERGLRELEIAKPASVERDALRETARALFEANGTTRGHGTLYLEITRGVAPRAHAYPPSGTPPTVLLTARSFVPPLEERAAGVTAITAPDLRWMRCDIKTVQLLPNVMANQRAHAAGAFEALFIRDGIVTEATHSTVFAVIDGTLRTHPLGPFVLPSITRIVVLELAAELKIPVDERPVRADELLAVDELFVAATTTDVTGVVRVDGATIGDGRPGPITRKLADALTARLDAFARA